MLNSKQQSKAVQTMIRNTIGKYKIINKVRLSILKPKSSKIIKNKIK